MNPCTQRARELFDQALLFNADVILMYAVISLVLITKFQLAPATAWPLFFGNLAFVAAAYTLNILTDKDEDAANGQHRPKALAGKRAVLAAGVLLLAAGITAYTYVGGSAFFAAGATLAAASVIYSFPVRYRLKNVPVLKNVVPAFCWYFSLCMLSFAGVGGVPLLTIMYLTSPLFFIFFAFEMLWDIPDRDGDARYGIRTLPVLIGSHRTRFLIAFMLALAFILTASRLNKVMLLALISFVLLVPGKASKLHYHYALAALMLGTTLVYALLVVLYLNGFIPATPFGGIIK